MEQIPFVDANSHSPGQEFSHLLLNPKIHYRVHSSSPLVAILNQVKLIHTLTPYSTFTLIVSSHLHLLLASPLLHSFVISHTRATCPALLILPDFVVLMVSGEAYKLWSSSLCSLLQPPVTSKYSHQRHVLKQP
jgi:hypothetical protein